MSFEILTKNLNPEQKRAVESLDGPLLILAGAGSGKTRVLTHRVANLIALGKAAPEQILAVTFTNKAAREMESRIFSLLTSLGIMIHEPMWVSTFHSFCVRLLKQYANLLDYKPYFAIYDDSDQLSALKRVLKALNIDDKVHPAKTFRSRINTAKMLGLSPDGVQKNKSFIMDELSLRVYFTYEEELKRANAMDFGDLLLKTLELFQMYPDILEVLQKKFKYIMVDEYQDTNRVQYLLIQYLARGHQNLCVVGDEDQSIYSWRGADISNILNFELDFPAAQVVKLEENYRSSGHIVAAATKLIQNNSERKNKTLFTQQPKGPLIAVREETNEHDEARYVVKTIKQNLQDSDWSLADTAIFYRTNAQSRVLEEQLRMNSLPYRIVGGLRFYDRMEVKDLIAYLRLSLNATDDVAIRRVINVPARGIGKTTLEKLEEYGIEKKQSLYDAIKACVDGRIFNAGVTTKLRGFITLIDDLQTEVKKFPLLDFYEIVLERTGYITQLKKEESTESEARIENLRELASAIEQFTKERVGGTLQDFLEEMALVSDVDKLVEGTDAVTLMTLHVSKGLEYPYVFIVGLEEGLFPRVMGDAEREAEQASEMEEERRLAYVGMTRAEKKLTLLYARSRMIWGETKFSAPSRFIKELPEETIEFTTAMERPSFVSKYSGRGQDFSSASASGARFRHEDSQDFPDYDSDAGHEPASSYSKGQRVKHPTFGFGSIFQVEGQGDAEKVSVLFADQTIKKFVTKYARLERI